MLYYFLKLFSSAICLLPQNVVKKLGYLLSIPFWPFVSPKRKNIAFNNASAALHINRIEARKLVRNSFTHLCQMFLDFLRFPLLSKENVSQYVKIIGRENIDEALAYGRGAIMATAHADNWELLGASLALYNYPIVGIAQKQKNKTFDNFIIEYRTMSGMHITYKTGVREMISLLGEGKIIGLIMDQDAKRQGIFVEFFGRPASTPSGAAALARMKDCPIIPIFITQNSDGSHTIIAHKSLKIEKTANRDQDILLTTQKLSYIIEDHIKNHPDEWFWLHNRWKTKPPVHM